MLYSSSFLVDELIFLLCSDTLSCVHGEACLQPGFGGCRGLKIRFLTAEDRYLQGERYASARIREGWLRIYKIQC